MKLWIGQLLYFSFSTIENIVKANAIFENVNLIILNN